MRKLKLQELGRVSIEEFQNSDKLPLTIILDNIRSAQNVGSFFRTADAFNIDQIILTGITARPPNREITKTAIGATKSVKWAYHEKVEDAFGSLEGYQLIAIEQTDESVPLREFVCQADKQYALIFGNEVQGVDSSILGKIDGAVEIEQHGTKHSLNVSVCGGVVLWEFAKQLQSF